LLHAKSQKQLILTGALRFNTKPKLGLTFLEENRLIYADDLPRELSLAKFLRSCPKIDKKLLGDFLSKPENLEVLEQFMGLLDFKDVSVPAHSRLSPIERNLCL
jgi:brefeldin A-resistance guanine nucleotide exchange factor 1